MTKVNPQEISGCWKSGYVLDRHTLKSVYIGDNEYGHPQFETTRSEMGELLFKLKYRNDHSVVDEIARTAAAYLQKWNPGINLLIPVTPSKVRAKQPVFMVGAEIAKLLKIAFSSELVIRREALPELKNVSREERTKLLKGVHDVEQAKVKGKKILLLDDLFQSGSTMNAICEALRAAECSEVFALALTKGNS